MHALEVLMTLVIASALELGCFWLLKCCTAGLRRAETPSSTVDPKTKPSASLQPPSFQCLDRQQAA